MGGTGNTSFTSGALLTGNGSGALTTTTKTSAATANTVVERDGSGNFSAGTITANLTGTATSANYIKLYEARGTTTTLNKAANYVAAGAMFHLVATSNTSAANNGKTPTDANVLQMNWDNNGGYDGQIAVSTNANRLYFRDRPSTNNTWQEVAHAPVGASDIGSSTQPVYMTSTGVITAGTALGASAYHADNYFALASHGNHVPGSGTTAQFLRGDNSWSNTIKQTSNATLGIGSNLIIGKARKDLNFSIANGSGTGIDDGFAGGITWGLNDEAYAGIYYQTSGSYGTRLILATTNLYADGAKARVLIAPSGYVGIGTLTPDTLLTVNGNAKATKFIGALQGNADTASKIAAKLAATTKTYLLGTSTAITATAANVEMIGDTGVYLTTTAGELSAVRYSWNASGAEKAYTVYNTTDNSIDFIFI